MKKELMIKIIAHLIGLLIKFAIMYGIYVWKGFEITALVFLFDISSTADAILRRCDDLKRGKF